MDKRQLTEQEIRTRYITPAIQQAGWLAHQIREEVYFTAGRIIVRGNLSLRSQQRKFADYVLYHKANLPLALVEAKDNTHPLGGGMDQAMEYAELLDIPFVFTSNGDGFMFHDRTVTRGPIESALALDHFPSPQQLWAHYTGLAAPDPVAAAVVAQPYHSDRTSKPPRYYQQVAINRTVAAIANGQRRILLVMATGTGKTLVAFHIIWRLWQARKVHRVLFLADRNILVDQTMTNDFKHFGDKMTKISGRQIDKSYEIYLALYQGLSGSEEWQNIYRQFSPDFFDLIVVDECHRGSAAEDSAWREVLEYFSAATKTPTAWMLPTATPPPCSPTTSACRLRSPPRAPASKANSSPPCRGAAMSLELLFPYFDELIRTPEDVERLNQTILQLAVRGKLVPQDPQDEPASELVRRIEADSIRLTQPREMLNAKTLRVDRRVSGAFPPPSGWQWTTIGDIAEVTSGITLGKDLARFETVTLPYLRVANVQRGYLDLTEIKYIDVKLQEKDKYVLLNGDLLLTEGGDADKLGRAAIWHGQIPNCIHQNHIFRARPIGAILSTEWLMLYINSSYGRGYFWESSKKTTNLASINSIQLKGCPIPLPPLAEQRRIMAKVDQLLRLCAELEAKLQAGQAHGQRLTAALLASATQ